jgi:hypothetical protein
MRAEFDLQPAKQEVDDNVRWTVSGPITLSCPPWSAHPGPVRHGEQPESVCPFPHHWHLSDRQTSSACRRDHPRSKMLDRVVDLSHRAGQVM